MSDTKICPECGHKVEDHEAGIGCVIAIDTNESYSCQCELSASTIKLICEARKERDEARALARKFYRKWRELDDLFEIGTPAGLVFARYEVAEELKEARAWAIYWRRMYDVQLRQNANLDCKVYIAEDERSEAARDLVDAENEIKRLRLMLMCYVNCAPMIYDGFGDSAAAWCENCGGDMQVLRPGKFQCAECGR